MKKPDALQQQINNALRDALWSAVLMGSAASTVPGVNDYQKTGATDTLVAICKQLSARVEQLIREGNTLVGALYVVEKEGWLDKVAPHMFASVGAAE